LDKTRRITIKKSLARVRDEVIKSTLDKLSTVATEGRIEDAILIFGPPRGGTTWIMEILETIPRYKSIFEPLHPYWFPESQRIFYPRESPIHRPYMPPFHYRTDAIDYFIRVFTGKVYSKHPIFPLTPRSILYRVLSDKVIVKFIRGNRLLPWITTYFNIRGVYLLLRHPCAVMASIKNAWRFPESSPPYRKAFLENAIKIREIRENQSLIKKLRNLKTPIELSAANWAIDTYVALSHLRGHPNKGHVVVYEALVTNFEEEVMGMFNYIGEDIPKKVFPLYHKPSRTTQDKSYLGNPKQLLKWKKRLSEHQIRKILTISHWFGLDFYTEAPEPDYDALKDWKPSF